jgi:NtrC-family two-component system response regulator AlgB
MHILVVDDEINIRKTLSICLESEGHATTTVSNYDDALAEASRRVYDMAFVDLRLGTANGLDLISDLLARTPWIKIVVITAYASIDTAVEAIKRGAFAYIPKPFTPAQIHITTSKITEVRTLEQRLESLTEDLGRLNPELELATTSPAMERALMLARQVAPSDVTILLRGENGTGKSMLARAIHGWSRRADKPFVVISCPALPAELLESELFGHAKGAFTGAVRESLGRIAACEGGTLFLDEVGDLPVSLQPKLLRFIQDREYERVGEHNTRRADVRIIAASNIDLEAAVREGRFREDLLYRLNVIDIEIPPLRERPEDIPGLADKMLCFFARASHKVLRGFTDEALAALRSYGWPGNIRELRNAVERAALLARTEWIGRELLPEYNAEKSGRLPDGRNSVQIGDPVSLAHIEEQHIRRVLAATKSLQEAADILGIDQATLWRRRKTYGI